KFEGERTLMRIHIGECDKWHGKPLHVAIVEMLRKDGFSGATVLRGVGGYGGSSVYTSFCASPMICRSSSMSLSLPSASNRFIPVSTEWSTAASSPWQKFA